MHELHYKYIKRKYDAKLLFIGTDNLVYKIKAEDVPEDFSEDKSLFDFSDYPQVSIFFDRLNKKVNGKMKDEFKEKIFSEFVWLELKIYFLTGVDGGKLKKAKGVNKNFC